MSHRISLAGIFVALTLITQPVVADAPLKNKLDLDIDQTRIVTEIQKQFRKEKRGIRQILNKESRKLRRARTANDSGLISKLTVVVGGIEQEMRQAILSEDNEIRNILNSVQLQKFDSYIAQRDAMVGSSRDVRVANTQ